MIRIKRFQTIAVLLPFVALVLWTVQVAWHASHGRSYRVKITGYDPVSFFSGHYLLFQYDLGSEKICPEVPYSEEVCVCLAEAADHTLEAQSSQVCDIAANRCAVYVRGQCYGPNFRTPSDRYFFDESYSQVLGRLPEQSSAEIVLNPHGDIQIKALYVRDLRIEDYAAQLKKSKIESTPN